MQLIKRNLTEIHPYEKNPRRNDGAVDAVAESIRQCEYVAPIIVDENGVILAGHTRYKALKKLGYTEAEVVVESRLTEEQKRKYRLLDNKTNELAAWDFELLESELEGLDFEGFDFGFDDNGVSYIDELLNDESVMSLRAGEKDSFEYSFSFPVRFREQLDNYLEQNTKQQFTCEVIKIFAGDSYGD